MTTQRSLLAATSLVIALLLPMPAVSAATNDSATWSRIQSGPWLVWEAVAFSPPTGRLVVFGGSSFFNGVMRDTHLYNPILDRWSTLPVRRNDPSARVEARMVWAPDLGRIVMFGGRDARGQSLRDTWAFNPGANTWQALISNCRRITCPPARWGQGMAWSSVMHSVLMFGGTSDPTVSEPLNDLWAFDGSAWTKIATSVGPSPRYLMGMAEDPTTGLVMVYGGADRTQFGLSDTWIFNPRTRKWSVVDTPTLPDQRSEPGMAWLPSIQKIVVSSGTDASGCQGRTNTTWAFDTTVGDWLEVTTTGGPPSPRNASLLTTDPIHGSAILLGPPDPALGPGQSDYAWILK